MNIEFDNGALFTTKELADILRDEGRLGTHNYCDQDSLRCVIGVIEDWSLRRGPSRPLTVSGRAKLINNKIDVFSNDTFEGTPEERCFYIVDLLEKIE